jgi:uncharacterized phage-associated protein
MASVNDVAAYILDRAGPMTAMKFQKLAYYSLAWHAVWDDQILFDCEIQAWRNGPVCPTLYEQHRGTFQLSSWPRGDANALAVNEKETIDAIVRTYGELTAQQLSDLTHAEDPWRNARAGLDPFAISQVPITIDAMVEYYSALGAEAIDVEPF